MLHFYYYPLKLLSLIQFVLPSVQAQDARCRCLSTDECWPSQGDFATLQSQLSVPLIAPQPLAAPCYPTSSPSGSCTEVHEMWFDAIWRATHPGQTQSPNWETFIFSNGTIDECPMNATNGTHCGQGSVPITGIDARTPGDIQAAVKFAVKHNLRVVVKNTGHDYLGRSTARGAFMIWTHNMKNITYNEDLVLAGAPSNAAALNGILTVSAGVQWHEAYDAVYAHNRDIVGGVTSTGSVGSAGGWIQGAGHSILSPTFGLGVDNAVQFTIVTSNGDHLIVNRYQNTDLFWALRGGGGGTYGVITSVSYQTHPSLPLVGAVFSTYVNATDTTTPSPVVKTLFTEFVRITPFLSESGWAGYAELNPVASTNATALSFFYLASNVSWAQANATIDPFFKFAANLAANSSVEDGGQLIVAAAQTLPPQPFQYYEKQLIRPSASLVGAHVEIGSRLLSGTLLATEYEKVADTILQLPATLNHLVAGGAVSRVDPESTGLNPAWREALIHTVVGQEWTEGALLADITAAKERVKQYTRILEDLAPDSGSYFNEASLYQTDPKQAFFGSHYDKLAAIKEKYDPFDLFIVAQGVGSDKWDATLNCRV